MYFERFTYRHPPPYPAIADHRQALWSMLAGLSIGLALWYLHWRWTASLNPMAMTFSIVVATAETLSFLGMLLFYYDIWSEGDTPRQPAPSVRGDVGLPGNGPVMVDIMITTYDEAADLVSHSIAAAHSVLLPQGVTAQIWLCDDGNRQEMATLAHLEEVGYLTRNDNHGFKAGNLGNALFKTQGDFIVICDADTRMLPSFLSNTLGYFRDPKVAWVQTPHWFYDIPAGANWTRTLLRFGRNAARLAPILRKVTGVRRYASDPFLSDPALFFDIIQRRRNRHGASFCCGAGSIHRREAVFQSALRRSAGLSSELAPRKKPFWHQFFTRKDARLAPMPLGLPFVDLQPFRHHVSEDILTSIQLHSDAKAGWISVYHPQSETRMLSPCSIAAWSIQRLKYAGGTYDIILRHNPLFRRGMPWRMKLHYAATFWSYLSALWMPVLLLAPAISLIFGIAPVQAYSVEFFMHLLPMLFVSELALIAACKGHDFHQGRILTMTSLPLQWRALLSVLRGHRPRFPVTPKSMERGGLITFLWPNLLILAFLLAAAGVGIARFLLGYDETASALYTNLFWLGLNALAIGWLIPACFWAPKTTAPKPHPITTRIPQT